MNIRTSRTCSVGAKRKYLIALAGITVATSVVVALCVHYGREMGRDVLTTKRFMFVGSALLGYEQEHGVLPAVNLPDAAGRPAHSWRVLLLPNLGAQDLFERYDFDEPWDGPNNQKLISAIPVMFQASDAPQGYTDVVAVVGRETVWRGKTPANTRAASSTAITVVQAKQLRPWTKPDDLSYEDVLASVDMPGGLSNVLGSKRYYVNLACEVQRLPADISKEQLRNLLTSGRGADGRNVESD